MSSKSAEEFDYDLMSIVVHDLKAPIASVKGFIDMLEHLGPLNERQLQFVERALKGLERMEQLVADLLDLSRLDSGAPIEMKPCNLAQLIYETVEIYETAATEHNIAIDVSIPFLPPIKANPPLLQRAISNLIGNAIKYNRDGGIVAIHAHQQDDLVMIDVKDTGAGIAPEDMEHIFERFFRAKRPDKKQISGTGLGLAIAAAVIERHGGRIWVESTLNEGSVFHVTLPCMTEIESVNRNQSLQSNAHKPYHEAGGEASDSVDDDLQESDQCSNSDSRHDEV